MKLTLTQLTAIQAVQNEIASQQAKLKAILAEAGLDPAGQYRIMADGTVEEAVRTGVRRRDELTKLVNHDAALAANGLEETTLAK